MDENVKNLLEKGAQSEKSDDALKFTQAALNAAHALQVLRQTEKPDAVNASALEGVG